MSMTVIVAIVFAVAMMVGPIFMLQPSRRQQHLAATRTAAAKLGLTVRLATLSKKRRVAVYTLGWSTDEEDELGETKYRAPALILERLDYEHGLHIAGYWSLSGDHALDAALKATLDRYLQSVPSSISGVEFNPGGVGLYWSEREGEPFLPQLKTRIQDLRSTLRPHVFQ